MEALEFIRKYQAYLDKIEKVVKDEHQETIEELRLVDPHDLVTPETYFFNEAAAWGYVFCLFLKSIKS